MAMCDNKDATAERWAPFSPPGEFDNADAKWTPACVLASRGGRGGRGEGQGGDVFLHTLIVQLGSQSFFLATRGWFNA